MEPKKITVEAFVCPHCNNPHLTMKSLKGCMTRCNKEITKAKIHEIELLMIHQTSLKKVRELIIEHTNLLFLECGATVHSLDIQLHDVPGRKVVEFTICIGGETTSELFPTYYGSSSFMGKWVFATGCSPRFELSRKVFCDEDGNRLKSFTAKISLDNLNIMCFRQLCEWDTQNKELAYDSERQRIVNGYQRFAESAMGKALSDGIEELGRQISTLTERRNVIQAMYQEARMQVASVEPKIEWESHPVTLEAIE